MEKNKTSSIWITLRLIGGLALFLVFLLSVGHLPLLLMD
jgi:hypothetical protein